MNSDFKRSDKVDRLKALYSREAVAKRTGMYSPRAENDLPYCDLKIFSKINSGLKA